MDATNNGTNGQPPHGQPRVLTGRCWVCHGDGWVELGMHSDTNVGFGHRCANCAGTGFVWQEVVA